VFHIKKQNTSTHVKNKPEYQWATLQFKQLWIYIPKIRTCLLNDGSSSLLPHICIQLGHISHACTWNWYKQRILLIQWNMKRNLRVIQFWVPWIRLAQLISKKRILMCRKITTMDNQEWDLNVFFFLSFGPRAVKTCTHIYLLYKFQYGPSLLLRWKEKKDLKPILFNRLV
jgi:hypothetical protein